MSSKLSKAELVAEIADALGVESPGMSTGSTEPKQIFSLVNESLGLGLSEGATKPEMARGIVQAAGQGWGASFESRGGTVTAEGLMAVREAVRFFLGR
jgi:hypothetical protein